MHKHIFQQIALCRQSSYNITNVLLIAALVLSACTAFPTEQDPSLKETQLELNVQETLTAQQATESNIGGTLEAQQATLDEQYSQATRLAQQIPVTETLDPSLVVEQTVQALQAAQQTKDATSVPVATDTPVTAPKIEFETWIKNAQILLYEDMTGQLDTNRYIKDTLDYMALPYTDVGSAKGWLQSQVTSNGPTGEGWDLVVIAAEAKQGGTNGEFFGYVSDLLDRGASVIFEVWFMDKMAGGVAGPLLARCGLAFQTNWVKVPPARLVMFPLTHDNPIMSQPNTSLSFTDVTSYWWNPREDIDVGDWMQIAPGGDAQLLVGAIAEETQTHGTVATCFNGQFILQTFSSHQLTFKAMKPVWENYIYNALKVRYER